MSDSLKEIDSKVTEIKVMLEKHIVAYDKDTTTFKEKQQQLSVDVWGKDGSAGMKIDVDRLKTQVGTIKWVAGAIGTVIIERIYSLFSGKH